jgi:hypothetical protein
LTWIGKTEATVHEVGATCAYHCHSIL